MSRVAFLIFAGVLLAMPALAHEYKLGSLEIEHPWARPSNVQNGAAYMTITTMGKDSDRLVSVTSPVADAVELHTHIMDGNIMRMRPVDGIDVMPGKPTELKPGGFHVMLLGLKHPLVAGSTFPLTLTFEKAGSMSVDVAVGNP